MNKQSCALDVISATTVNRASPTKLTDLKELRSTLMQILQEDGVLQMQTMLTMCYQGLVLLYVMLTVLWFGAANSRPRLLYQLPKQNILQCLRLFRTCFQFKILSRRLAVFISAGPYYRLLHHGSWRQPLCYIIGRIIEIHSLHKTYCD